MIWIRIAPAALALTLTLTLAAALLPASHQGHAAVPLIAACAPGDIVHPVSAHFVSIEPRRGFNPLAASNAVLQCYGFPPRPTDSTNQHFWTVAMKRFHYVVPTAEPLATGLKRYTDHHTTEAFRRPASVPHLMRPADTSPVSATDTVAGPTSPTHSTNWTGYEILSANNGYEYFTNASAIWSVPYLQTMDPKAKVASWVGLGNGGGGSRGNCCIWQAGVQDYNVNGDPSQFWFEDFGCTPPLCPSPPGGQATENEIVVSNPSVSAGDSVYVAVDNGYPNRPVTYYMQNYRTGQGTSTVSVQNVDNTDTGLQAEFIVEENGPCSPGNCPYVPDVYGPFTDPAFVGAQATAGSDVRNLTGWNYTRIDLCNGNTDTIVAIPSDVSTNTGFHISNYGQVYPTFCPR